MIKPLREIAIRCSKTIATDEPYLLSQAIKDHNLSDEEIQGLLHQITIFTLEELDTWKK